MLLSQARRGIERLHSNYLCSEFKLSRPQFEDGPAFDLIGGNTIFELKSRTFPLNQEDGRRRFRSDYGWWQLDDEQIKRYEQWVAAKNYSLSWIFVLAEIENKITLCDSFSEEDILHRDIYVVPWEVYKLVGINPQGTYRNLGLRRIKRNYSFTETSLVKGKLSVEKGIEEVVADCF